MIALVTNDWHVAARNPSGRKDDYNAELFSLIDQIFARAFALRAEGHEVVVLHGGDLFDVPRVPIAVIVPLIRRLMALKAQGIPLLTVPGNHDLDGGRPGSLPATALGLLAEVGLVTLVSLEHPYQLGNRTVAGLPWPQGMDAAAWKASLGKGDILIAHAFASEAGGEFFGEPVQRYADMAGLGYSLIVMGHDHSDRGIRRVDSTMIADLGSLCRGSRSYEDIARSLTFGEIDLATWAVRTHVLNHAPASEIFDLVEWQAKKDDRAQIEKFVADLQAGLADEDQTALPFADRLSKLELPAEVRARALAYLSGAEGSGVA